jgi:hypothetical protein
MYYAKREFRKSQCNKWIAAAFIAIPDCGRPERLQIPSSVEPPSSQKTIRRLQRVDTNHPQLLRQASLPGVEVALAAAARLGRISGNHLNPQLAQRPSHLGRSMLIHFPSPTFSVNQKWLPRSPYSAQNTQVIFFAMARKITSYLFIGRSVAAFV